MALVAGQWSRITFKALSNAAWATVPSGALPATVLQAVRDGTTLFVHCTDDSGPVSFTYLDGPVVTVDAAVIDTETAVTTNLQVMDDGDFWYSARNTAGHWLWYSHQTGLVRSLSTPSVLGAFIT
jgi:hypothetical protein